MKTTRRPVPCARRVPRATALALAVASLLLAGCESLNQTMNPRPPVDVAQPTALRPQPIVLPPINNGAIFQTGQYRPLFEDHRARLVGDTLTVQIIEKVTATQKSTSSIDKGGGLAAGVTAIPGIAGNSFTAGRANIGATSSNTFAGKGSTENSNDFSGTITATVIDVLPNGHLLVAGEKQIGVNHNVDVLRFSGQVDHVPSRPATAWPRRRSRTCASSSAAAVRRPMRRELAGWDASF